MSRRRVVIGVVAGFVFLVWVTAVTGRNEENRQTPSRSAASAQTTAMPGATREPTKVPTPRATRKPRPTPEPNGRTIDTAVPMGREAIAPNNVVIEILDTIPNATQIVVSENMFNATPEPGDRYYIIRVKLTNKTRETLIFSHLDFSLIGDRRLQYHDIFGCGVLPDALEGEVWPGGYVEGNICFKVPSAEGGFILMYDPDIFSNRNRAFLQVE